MFEKAGKVKIIIEANRQTIGHSKLRNYLPYRSMSLIEQFLYQDMMQVLLQVNHFRKFGESKDEMIRDFVAQFNISDWEVDIDNIRRKFDRYREAKRKGAKRLFLKETPFVFQEQRVQKGLFD